MVTRQGKATVDEAKHKAWAGVDVGKGFHWAIVLDAERGILLSRRLENEEAELSAFVEEALGFGLELTWGFSNSQPLLPGA